MYNIKYINDNKNVKYFGVQIIIDNKFFKVIWNDLRSKIV